MTGRSAFRYANKFLARSNSLRSKHIIFRSVEDGFEWYVNEEGNSPGAKYYQEELGEGDNLFAFKPKPHRFMAFFVKGKTVIITHGFLKKRDDLPPNEREKAKAYRRDYTDRNTTGCYYDEQAKGLR